MNISHDNIIVQKYGGTSVGDTDRIKIVAARIKSYHERGFHLVVVVSAMGKTTNSLVQLAAEISDNPSKREMDMLLSTGEQVSIALLAMALEQAGVPAVSFVASQINIRTDGNHSNARIEQIDDERLLQELSAGKVCIVAGFQGIDAKRNITTLGRGGSDTSAVALAAALKAKECEIFTDVDGIYTADPNKVLKAKKLQQISYDEMLELASLGAKVLHSRSVEFAKKYNVALQVRSSFNFTKGTMVVAEEKIMEKLLVTGVSIKKEDTRISVVDVPDRPGVAAELFRLLAQKNINVDMIVQSSGKEERNTISFTVPQAEVQDAQEQVKMLMQEWGSGEMSVDDDIAIVSAVGVGMKSHSGVAADMFKSLADDGINIEMISTSEIKISCVVRKKEGEKALRAVHTIFGLDRKE